MPTKPTNTAKPTPPVTVEEAASQVRRAAVYVAESEERYAFMQKAQATLFDELKVARRTLAQAERNLLVVSKRSPGAVVVPVTGSPNKAVNLEVKVS